MIDIKNLQNLLLCCCSASGFLKCKKNNNLKHKKVHFCTRSGNVNTEVVNKCGK